MKEQELMVHIAAQISRDGRARVYRNNVGTSGVLCSSCKVKVCAKCRQRLSTPIHFGLGVGSGDLIGLTEKGRFISVEVKTEKGKVSPEQQMWYDFINKFGGKAYIIRSVDEVVPMLDEACDECSDT